MAPKIRSPAPAPLMEEMRAPRRRCSSRAGSRSAPSSIASGTARNRACSAPPSGRRRTPPNCSAKRRSTSTPMATAAASCGWKARTRSRSSSTAWRRDIDDPETKVSVWKRLQAERLARAAEGAGPDRQEARTRADLRIGALGSGSDYTAFLDHLGIASIEPRLRRRRRRAASTTPSTTISTGTRISRTPISSTAARWRRPPAPR